ncbi:18615_t:CDS:2 [Acaulospora morrowiae]|uniref:18615_t:CDS:1 n=1 Tax=Acaulospora morrowiae TaxID=94023 RepID=A0A9N9NHY1_9GLOM|nr:18615_t:CDS:2 [Acaulospora morrowiae]
MSTFDPINLNNKQKDASQQNDVNKRTRVSLTALQKKELCERMQVNPILKQKDMAKEYKISKQAVSDILRQEKIWSTIETGTASAKQKRNRKPAFIEIDDAMKLWVEHVLIHSDINLNDSILMERALAFTKEFGYDNKFLASSGCVNMEDIPQFRADLQNILKKYDYRDIFNCDETALYWQLESDRSIAHMPLPGKKKSKERITLLLTCNASGDEKLPILFIHKYESPRALKSISKSTLPVWYYWNAKA